MTPWLSILIPVYDVEAYLSECLDSIVQNNLEGIEIIALNDCSTDSSLAILMLYAKKYKNFQIIEHTLNSGVSAARNSLLSAAHGTYLWFIDADDAITVEAIPQLKKIITDANYPDLILCDYSIWREEPISNHRKPQKENHVASFLGTPYLYSTNSNNLFSGLFAMGRFHLWSKIAKREVWNNNLRFPVGKHFEDMSISPVLAYWSNSYIYYPHVWIKYRQRQGSILATPSIKKIYEMVNALNGTLELWSNHKPPLNNKDHIQFFIYCIKIYQFAIKDLSRLKLQEKNHKKNFRNIIYQATATRPLPFALKLLKSGKIIQFIRFFR